MLLKVNVLYYRATVSKQNLSLIYAKLRLLSALNIPLATARTGFTFDSSGDCPFRVDSPAMTLVLGLALA